MNGSSLRGLVPWRWFSRTRPADPSRQGRRLRRHADPVTPAERLEPRAVMAIDIPTVLVGNANNAADPATGYGGVDHAYRIGTHEVTINQYVAFLNSVATVPTSPAVASLYDSAMAGNAVVGGTISRTGAGTAVSPYSYAAIGNGNRPVPWVTWFDAARMANWIHNGATSTSSTETGAYTLNGAMQGIITRNPTATWWIPHENEWYKAAYYDPTLNSGAGGYWKYPTRSNTPPVDEASFPGAANSANYNSRRPEGDKLTPVGGYSGSPSGFGTFDQGGNLREWTSGVVQPAAGSASPAARVIRGGSWGLGLTAIAATQRHDSPPGLVQDGKTGFRLATTATATNVPATRPVVDLDGDGNGDTIWRTTAADGTTQGYVGWLQDSKGTVVATRTLSEGADRELQAAAHFTDDAVTDLVWRNRGTNATKLWSMNGDGTIAAKTYLGGRNAPEYRIAGSGDYDADGSADLVWRNDAADTHTMWLMNGTQVADEAPLAGPKDARLVATAADYDGNGDGRADLVWKHPVTNVHTVRLMNGTSTIGGFHVAKGTGWDLVGTGTYDPNKVGDLLWRNAATGSVVQWLMTYDPASDTGQFRKETELARAGTPRTPVPSLSHGGNTIAWRRPADGTYSLWKMLGSTATSKTPVIGGGPTQRLVRRLPYPTTT